MGTEYAANCSAVTAAMVSPAAWTEELMSVCTYWNRIGIMDSKMTL